MVAYVELEDESKRNKELSVGLSRQGDKVQVLEESLAKLKGSLPLRDEQVIEELCNSEQPWLKITYSFITGFLLCKAAALEDPDHLEDLAIPLKFELTPELVKSVKERRSDAVVVLQYLRENAPEVLANW